MRRRMNREVRVAVKSIEPGQNEAGRPTRRVLISVTGDVDDSGYPDVDDHGDITDFGDSVVAFGDFSGNITWEHDLAADGKIDRTGPDKELVIGQPFGMIPDYERHDLLLGMEIDNPIIMKTLDTSPEKVFASWKGIQEVDKPELVMTAKGRRMARRVYPKEVWNVALTLDPSRERSRVVAVKSKSGIELKEEIMPDPKKPLTEEERTAFGSLLDRLSDDEKKDLLAAAPADPEPDPDPEETPADPEPTPASTDPDPEPTPATDPEPSADPEPVMTAESVAVEVAAKSAANFTAIAGGLEKLTSVVAELVTKLGTSTEEVAAKSAAETTRWDQLVEKMESIGTGLEKIGKARATGPQAVRGDFAAKGSVEALNKIPRTVVLDQMREVVAKAKDPGERRRLEVACIEMTRAMDKQG